MVWVGPMTWETSKEGGCGCDSLWMQPTAVTRTAFLLIALVITVVLTIATDSTEALVDHDPIDIRSSADLTAENGIVAGSGSSTDPYIIEGWSINTSTFHAVYLYNIHSHLVIRDMAIYYHPGTSGSFQGISANRVSNLRIENVTVHEMPIGISIDSCSGVELVSIRCYNSGRGYSLESTTGLEVSDCLSDGGSMGIDIDRCLNAMISNTKIVNHTRYGIFNRYNAGLHYVKLRECNISDNFYGVCLEDTAAWTFTDCVMDNEYYNMELHTMHHTIQGCRFGKTGITFRMNARYWAYQNIDDTNTVNGLPLLYLKNATDLTIDRRVGQAFLVNCENVTLKDQHMEGCLNAIGLIMSSNCTIVNNTVIDPRTGIFGGGWHIVGNRIISNTIQMGRTEKPYPINIGISYWGRSVHIEGNRITGIDGYPIYLGPDDLMAPMTNYTLVDNVIDGQFEIGIYLYPDSLGTGKYFAGNFTISGGKVSRCEVGIQSHYWGATIEGCTVAGCNRTGMLFEAMTRLTIKNCTLRNSADNVLLYACKGSVFTGNTIEGQGGSRGLVSNASTNIYNSSSKGAPSLISDNRLSNLTTGFDIDDAQFLTLERNVLLDIDGNAIDLYGCYGSSITNSSALRCQTGVLVEHSTDTTISLNDIEGCSVGICIVSSVRLNINHNRVLLSEGHAIHVMSGGQNRIFHNTFDRNNMRVGSSSYLGPQARDDASGNTWDNGLEGNWWSDYTLRYPEAKPLGRIWDTPYSLESKVSGGVVDKYPLSTVVDLEAPVAIAGTNMTIKVGEDCWLDGTASTDNYGVVSFIWTLKDLTPNTFHGATVTLTFNEPGIFDAILNVTDAWGNWDIDCITITVLEVIPTVADAGPDLEVDSGQFAVLDGSGSTAEGGVVNFTWSLTMGGEEKRLHGEIVHLKCSHVGVYTVTLEVVGGEGGRDDDTMMLTVRDVRPPMPIVDAEYSCHQFQTLFLDGTGSWDDVGVEVYQWLFVYDGEPVILTGETTEFTFDIAGTYSVTLLVKDAAGNSASLDFKVTVMDAEPPRIAHIADMEVYVGETVELRHNGVTDNIKTTNFEWEIRLQDSMTTYVGEHADHVFDDVGTHVVTFKVTDEEGNFASLSFNVSVRPYDVPIADAGPDQEVDEGSIVTFDGSGSRDNYGDLEYNWTFEYDGAERTIFGIRTSSRFDIPGIYVVALSVRNSRQMTATDSLTIRVLDRTPPNAIAGVDVSVRPGSWVSLDGSFSTDNVGIVNYTWETSVDGDVVRVHGVKTSIKFDEEGSYVVKLIVMDADGNIGTDELLVTVESDRRSTALSPILIVMIFLIIFAAVVWIVIRTRGNEMS